MLPPYPLSYSPCYLELHGELTSRVFQYQKPLFRLLYVKLFTSYVTYTGGNV